MENETKWLIGAIVAVAVCVLVFCVLNKGCQRMWSDTWAGYSGADWLVVQYAQDGSVITYWKIDGEAVGNEDNSDGIYFKTDHGLVHLSGHYIYVQDWDEEMFDRLVTKRLNSDG